MKIKDIIIHIGLRLLFIILPIAILLLYCLFTLGDDMYDVNPNHQHVKAPLNYMLVADIIFIIWCMILSIETILLFIKKKNEKAISNIFIVFYLVVIASYFLGINLNPIQWFN